MRYPHVPHVLVAQVTLMELLHLLARLRVGMLEQLMGRHALDRHLAYYAKPAQADTCKVEQSAFKEDDHAVRTSVSVAGLGARRSARG